MRPDRIIIVRHGESEGNVDLGIYEKIPDYQLALTEAGRNQAHDVGRRIAELTGGARVQFYVSPYQRTRETLKGILTALDGDKWQKREDPRLREQDWGHLRSLADGKDVDAARDGYGTFFYRIPDGESGADVYDRVSSFLDTLHRDFEKADFPRTCVIVTHGLTMRLFLMRWFHWSVEEFQQLKNPPNCYVCVMEKGEGGKYRLAEPFPAKAEVVTASVMPQMAGG